MIPSANSAKNPARITPAAWDALRLDFHQSMLLDTSLRSLAENIDGCSWPVADSTETPASYIDLDHAEAIERLAKNGLPPAKLDLLADILRGTMSFDASFGDMLEIASKAEADSDIVHRNLERLGIARDFPVRLCNFTPGMHDFCKREQVLTLEEFLGFTRGASRQVIIGGEFRELLNAVTHIDEHAIARFLPFRVKTSGLYLVESIALLVRALPDAEREQLARTPESISPELRARIAEYETYFAEQTARIQAAFIAGTPLDRLVAPLDDLALEPSVAALLGLVIKPKPAPDAAPAAAKSKPPGLLARLLRHLRV